MLKLNQLQTVGNSYKSVRVYAKQYVKLARNPGDCDEHEYTADKIRR